MNIKDNEEFILNGISCLTNILFYDTPLKDKSQELLNQQNRIGIFKVVNPFIYTSSNVEIQIETIRVLSNLSRHEAMCQEFTGIKSGINEHIKEGADEASNFLEALQLIT
jgi:hypothetical protein